MAPTSLSPVVNPLLLEATLGSTKMKGSTEDWIVIVRDPCNREFRLVSPNSLQRRISNFRISRKSASSSSRERFYIVLRRFQLLASSHLAFRNFVDSNYTT